MREWKMMLIISAGTAVLALGLFLSWLMITAR